MLDNTQINARELIIESIDKLIEKFQKKADKEKQKKNNASVTYQGETYHTDAELQEAYACDVFTSATYDRLLDKLEKARGNVDAYELTPSECLVIELGCIKENMRLELQTDEIEKKRQKEKDERAKELSDQGYSYREIEAIMGNEELMRYE